ncbi:Protein PLANT CADMIUM RESISTANCE 3, partial [Mucuna pruriens]
MAALGGSWSSGFLSDVLLPLHFLRKACCVHGLIFVLLGGFTNFGSLYACLYRTKLRRTYGIQGTLFCDCVVSFCCVSLSICQEHRELQARGFHVSAGWNRNVELDTPGVMQAPSMEAAMNR